MQKIMPMAVLVAAIALLFFARPDCLAQDIPLVYEVEHTGSELPETVLPAFDDLPAVRPLPDPFAWSDGSGRSTEFKDWARRRSEIKAEIEQYGVGEKPGRPKDIAATFKDGTLTVKATENGETLTLTAKVSVPKGEGPFPAVIGIGFGGGSIHLEAAGYEVWAEALRPVLTELLGAPAEVDHAPPPTGNPGL